MNPRTNETPGRRPPLDGLRVADFTWVWAGPFCSLQLAHLGAEVVRVESATRTCVTRLLPPWPDGIPHPDRSGYFNQYNQGKKSISLDLGREEAREVARDLVRKSDVVVENFAAGVMDRIGLGWETCRALRPDVVMISLSGYGATGPQSRYVSYGPAQVPLSGFSSLTGYRGWRPMHVGISYGDPTAGLHGAVAVLAALFHRRRTGEGQFIDLSQWESTMALLPEGLLAQAMEGEVPARDGNHDTLWAPHAIYRAAGNDRWVAIAVSSDEEWRALAAVVHPAWSGDPELAERAGRKRREDEIDERIGAWCATRSREDVCEALQKAGVAALPVLDARDLHEDAHLGERDFFVELPHPEVGVRRHLGIPYRLHGSPIAVRRAAPCLGQDTEEVLRDVLGYDAERIATLRRSGALR